MLIMIIQAISALATLIGLAMFILVLIKLFREKGLLHGILGFFCGLYPFIWGWAKHKRLDLTKKMAIWSACTVIPFICGGAAVAIVGQAVFFDMISGVQETLEMVQTGQKQTPPKIPKKPAAAQAPKKVADPFKQSVVLWKDGKYKNPPKAVAYLNQVIGKNPKDAASYNNRGAAYLDLNQFQQALKDFSKAIAIDKAYELAYNNRGNTHYAMGNYQAALADYQQSIRLSPKNAHTYFNRGLAYYQLKKIARACNDFEKACKMGDCEGTNWALREGLCQFSSETLKLLDKTRRVTRLDTPLIDNRKMEPMSAEAKLKNPISQKPLSGTINGVKVKGFKAIINNAAITLYTGESRHFDYGTRLTLFNVSTDVENQDVTIGMDKGFHAASIHLDSKDHKGFNGIIQKNLKIRLISGKEKDYRVPASLRIIAKGKTKINLEGQIVIATSGLVARDGVVNITHDHLDTIEYVAQRHVESKYKRSKVDFIDKKNHSMTNLKKGQTLKKGRVQSATYSAIFKVDKGKEQIMKMQLAKKKKGWIVAHALNEMQIYAAHKLNPPYRNTIPFIFSPMAAKHFEKNFYKGWKKMNEPMNFSCGGGHRPEVQGYCEINYKIYKNGNKKKSSWEAKTYLFDKDDSKVWKIVNVLPKEKKYNRITGQIEDRKRKS